MDLKQQYPRTSSFNQLKNPLNINSLIFSRHAYCLMNLRNCAMEMTLSASNFFPPVRLSSNCRNFFHLESRIAKADRLF